MEPEGSGSSGLSLCLPANPTSERLPPHRQLLALEMGLLEIPTPGEFYLLAVLLQDQEGHQGGSLLPLEGSRSIPGICCGISQTKPFFH